MCFGVTSDYNEHTCLCLLRSLCLPPSNVHAITEASTSEHEFILLPAYEFPDVKKNISIVIEIAHLERMKNCRIPSRSFKFRLTLYDRVHTQSRTLSELIISIARVSRGSVSVFRDNRTCVYSLVTIRRASSICKKRRNKILYTREIERTLLER